MGSHFRHIYFSAPGPGGPFISTDMKRIIISLACSVLLFGVQLKAQTYWDGTADVNFSGSGTVDSPYLKSIDYSRCPDLGMIGWHGVQVGSVDLSHNPKLYYFNLGGSALKELDLSASAIFERLISRDNPSLETVWLKKGTVLSECEIEPHTKILYK